MPLYTMKNVDTGEFSDVWLKIAEREQYFKDNPNMVQEITQVNMGDPIKLGVTKRHSALTDKLKSIKKAHRGSTISV